MNQTKILSIGMLAILLIAIASAVTLESVSTSSDVVSPGSDVSVSMSLRNNLDDDITGVDVSLDLGVVPFSPVSTSDKFVGDMDSDERASVRFDLIADSDAAAGVYKIPVKISYSLNSTQTRTSTGFISVTVSAKPILVLSSQGSLIEGQNNKFQVQITNIGLAQAKFLQVKIEQGNYNVLSSGSVYIGDLNSNDFDTASFDIFLKGKVASIPITLVYQDFANNQYTESQIVPVLAYTKTEATSLGLIKKSNTLTYLIAIVVIVIIYLIYRRREKNKKKNSLGGK